MGSLIKDWLPILAILLSGTSAIYGYLNRRSRIEVGLRTEIDGIGSNVSALEITTGRHEGVLDSMESRVLASERDQKYLYAEVGRFGSELAAFRHAVEEKETTLNSTLREILVGQAKLETKVDLLLTGKISHD